MNLIIALGSNMGDKKRNLENALKELSLVFSPAIEESSVYQSEPFGDIEQDDFYNMVVHYRIDDTLPQTILSLCLAIEDKLGRLREVKWGPRIIDIDILFLNDLVVKLDNLTIPHPFINQRSFVLLPLKELAIYNDLKLFYKFEDLSSTFSYTI